MSSASAEILAGDLFKGVILRLEGGLYKVTKTEHVKPGKGGAFMQAVMQKIGPEKRKLEIKFRVEEKLKMEYVFKIPGVFVERNGDELIFINMETQDTESIEVKNVEFPEFLQDAMEVELHKTGMGELIGFEYPSEIRIQVIDAPMYIKGQTASDMAKSVELANHYKLKVPQYIEKDDYIIVKINEEGPYYANKG